jgi:hypothetical protein
MDVSKVTNGSKTEVLGKRSVPPPKGGQPNAVRSEAKKADKTATGKEAKTEHPQVKAIKKIEIRKARLPLLRKRRLSTQIHQAARSPVS